MLKRIKTALEESALVMAMAIISAILAAVLIWLSITLVAAWGAHSPIDMGKAPQSGIALPIEALDEPMDIQPAGGYKLLQNTDNPQ